MNINSIEMLLKVKKEDVHIICTFLEGFEHCASLRTPKASAGPFTTLQLMIAPDFMKEIKQALSHLKKEGIKIAITTAS
jgi:hypothetical protein